MTAILWDCSGDPAGDEMPGARIVALVEVPDGTESRCMGESKYVTPRSMFTEEEWARLVSQAERAKVPSLRSV